MLKAQLPGTKVNFMVRIFILGVLTVVNSIQSQGQSEDVGLKKKILALTNHFNGDVGVYVKNLKSGKTVSINADTVFPTASMIKIPITIGVFHKIEKGELSYDTILTYKDSLLYAGEDILGSFKNGEKIALRKILMLMITTSDNTASLWCQSLAGSGTAINHWLQGNSYINTRVNSRTPGRENGKLKYGWGQTTPREMATLITSIREGRVLSERASERIYRNMTRIYWDSEALSQIPPTVQVASKQGAVDQSRSEVVLVNAPHGDYVFCVITKNQKDESWNKENEGFVLLRNISKIIWDHFEPKAKWKPAEKIEEWY